MGVSRKTEREKACLKLLINAADSLTSLAPAAISSPSADQAIALAEIAGAARASRDVANRGRANSGIPPNLSDLSDFYAQLAKESRTRCGKKAPGLIGAADGEMERLLWNGTVPKLESELASERPIESWIVDPAYKIEEAAAFL